jgi:hypothetical protein
MNLYQAVEQAQAKFWEEIVRCYPDATAGDFDPLADHEFERACASAVRLWVKWNVPRTFFHEHPEIEFPKKLMAAGFTDQSWHNDSCGKCVLYLAGEDIEADLVNVWVTAEEREDREYTGQKRFMVEILLNEDEWGTCEGLVAETEDMEDVLKIAAEARAAFASGGHAALSAYRKPVTPSLLTAEDSAGGRA